MATERFSRDLQYHDTRPQLRFSRDRQDSGLIQTLDEPYTHQRSILWIHFIKRAATTTFSLVTNFGRLFDLLCTFCVPVQLFLPFHHSAFPCSGCFFSSYIYIIHQGRRSDFFACWWSPACDKRWSAVWTFYWMFLRFYCLVHLVQVGFCVFFFVFITGRLSDHSFYEFLFLACVLYALMFDAIFFFVG